jgi:hypothetical protein
LLYKAAGKLHACPEYLILKQYMNKWLVGWKMEEQRAKVWKARAQQLEIILGALVHMRSNPEKHNPQVVDDAWKRADEYFDDAKSGC